MSDLSGKWTAQMRIDKIADPGSFVEMDKYVQRSNAVLGYPDVTAPGEGVITGWATIDGRPVVLFAQDYAVLKGSVGTAHADKIVKAIDLAAKSGLPVVCVWDSGGARVQEGAAALAAYGRIMKKLTDVSGVVPTISLAAGEMLGAAALLAPLTDFTIAVDKISAIGLYPPMVLASQAGVDVDENALLGAQVQTEKTGNAAFFAKDEEDAVALLKNLLTFLPANNLEEAPYGMNEDDPMRLISAQAGDTRKLIGELADGGDMLEVYASYAPDMVTAFARLDGCPVGVIANVPEKALTPTACLKATRFLQFLDAFDLPVVTIVNNLGAEATLEQAQSCQTRAFAKLAYAYAQAGNPQIQLVTGRAIGEGYVVMGGKGLGADLAYAWPDAEISPLEAEAGGIVLMNSKGAAKEYQEKFATAKIAAQQGVLDDVIAPEETRKALIAALALAANKRETKLPKKHGVSPL